MADDKHLQLIIDLITNMPETLAEIVTSTTKAERQFESLGTQFQELKNQVTIL